MASTSASSIQKSFKYDVFLSFRGEDTRKKFVDHLYLALKQRGINTYKDDEEIKKGKRIRDELITSIEDSKFYIIVFSKSYASSSWCLEELVKIMECQKTNGQTAYPVFYDVEPTEVRNQSGAVGEALSKHVNEEAVARWRDALKEAANLAGWELKTTLDGHEAKFIQKIVEDISLELRFIDLSVDGKLVGMDTRVKDVVTSLETDIDDVRMIGIKGIGGGGKTTLARVVFDQISVMFEGSSFVENVREVSKGSLGGLKSLQKQILSDVLNDPDIIVKGVSDLKKMLCGRKVLVVLDDVDHINQLEALAGEPNWFKTGSRIIITTREEQVLVAHGVPKNFIRDVNLLSHEEATCLFNRYAFGRVIPHQGYDILSNQVVRYASGLPLTIKVLGSFLRGKDELEWTDALERLKTIPLKETLEILELSYKSLEAEYQEIFLDVACILKGWDKEEAITALESCGFHGRNGLRALELKSLITVSGTGHLSMHDHIEEMGKNIVRRLHPNEPSRHSRLWNQDEIKDILVEDKVRFPFFCKGEKTSTYLHETTRCIIVWRVVPVIVMKGLRKMKELRFLNMKCGKYVDGSVVPYLDVGFSYKNIDEDNLYLPNTLQYIRLECYPFKYLPKKFQANNLVGLTIHFTNIDQLWKEKERKVLKKLRFLGMSYCNTLRSLDIGLIPNLERLSLAACLKLEELHLPLINSNLTYLNLCKTGLRTLDLERAQNLNTLKVKDHICLAELRMPIESLNLKHLTLHCSMLRTLNFKRYQNIETLNLTCNDLVELHLPIEKLKRLRLLCSRMQTLNLMHNRNLEALRVLNCNYLLELHMPIESPELETIAVSCPMLRTLNLTGSRNLKLLVLGQCENLVELHMPIESTKLKIIRIPRSMLRTLNLTGYLNLEQLDLEQCVDLVELHMPFESPNLKTINIYRSKLRILNLTKSQNLERLDLVQCADLVELHMPIESPNLKTISIPCSMLRTLNLTGSRNLTLLVLGQCENLVELHMPIESPKLKIISISRSKLTTLNLVGYQNLEQLVLEQCEDLVELHMPFESPNLKTINISHPKMKTLNLTGSQNLERLDLGQCADLVELHMPIESPSLKTINIPCSKLRTLNLTRVWNLETLDLEKSVDLVELHMPIESPKLETINIRCSKLRTLNLIGTPNLEMLDLEKCEDLVELHMPTESRKLKTINIRCSKLRILDLGLSPYLEGLYLDDCFNLVEIHALFGWLSGYVRFKPFVVNQGSPKIGSSAELHLTARSLGICPLHPDYVLPKFHFECIYKDLLLPSSTSNFKKLITNFAMCACTNLASISGSICDLQCLRKLTLEGGIPEVPKEIEQLECLEELTLLSTNIEHLPDSICMLKHLKLLQLNSCWLLKQLPEDLGRLEFLEEMRLTDCISLQDIPSSICEMKHLKCFHLKKCTLVEKLPKEIGRLKCLKELNIEGTGISDIPESIFQLEDLQFFI